MRKVGTRIPKVSQQIDSRQYIEGLGLKIERTTGGEFYLRCPFHADRSPSLCVSATKPIWWCHSCDSGGHLFKLGQLMRDPASQIVDHVGEVQPEQEMKYISSLKLEDYPSLPSARDLKYFFEHNISTRTVDRWGVKRTKLFIVFPVIMHSELNGLVLRSLIKEIEPRYQNRPTGFQRREYLYGHNMYEPTLTGMTIVTEGPSDCMRVWQAGFTSVVATFGGYVTEKQVELIKSLSSRTLLFFDNDEAGLRAYAKVGEILSLMGREVYVPDFTKYPEKGDPASLSDDVLEEVLAQPMSYLQYRIANAKKEFVMPFGRT